MWSPHGKRLQRLRCARWLPLRNGLGHQVRSPRCLVSAKSKTKTSLGPVSAAAALLRRVCSAGLLSWGRAETELKTAETHALPVTISFSTLSSQFPLKTAAAAASPKIQKKTAKSTSSPWSFISTLSLSLSRYWPPSCIGCLYYELSCNGPEHDNGVWTWPEASNWRHSLSGPLSQVPWILN